MGGFTRVFARLLPLACVMAAVLGPATMAGAQGEAIHDYAIDITIRGDGSLLVAETIQYDFGSTPHHGIFRDIPDRLTYDSRFDRVFPIHVISVDGSPGTPTHYVIQHDGNLFRIKIGDPDRTITGTHVYRIAYRVEGAMNGFPDHDELYWNALGKEWPVPVDSVAVTVRAPADIQRVACFAGPAGSNLPCASASAEGAAATYSQLGLGPYEGSRWSLGSRREPCLRPKPSSGSVGPCSGPSP